MVFEVIELVRHDPALWEEVVLQREEFLKTFQIPRQVPLASDLKHGWEMVDLLVRFETLESI